MRLVLASASPRRRELLQTAGVEFDVDAAHIDETRHAAESPSAYVERVAREKAQAVAPRHPGRPVLAADTEVIVDGEVLGKPRDGADAARMLQLLSGRSHEVLTAVALSFQGGLVTALERATVWMRALSSEEIAAYVASGEPMDKAGGYAIQGGAAQFIPRIEGALETVVGLPVATVLHLLRQSGAIKG